ncbi:MAG: c-type cytochrome [Acidobacteriota bacterium]
MIGFRPLLAGASIAWVVASTPPALAQGKFPPDAFTNLQVLPKTSTAGDVIGAMKEFSRALGVRCQHCHVGREGLPLDQFNFVSDENEKKGTARVMMRLVQSINLQLRTDTGREPAPRVTCYTCHRGAEHPVHSPEAIKPAP